MKPDATSWTRTRARLAARKRHRPQDDHSALEDRLAAEIQAARLDEHVRALIDSAPALSPEHLARLRALLPPVALSEEEGGAPDAT